MDTQANASPYRYAIRILNLNFKLIRLTSKKRYGVDFVFETDPVDKQVEVQSGAFFEFQFQTNPVEEQVEVRVFNFKQSKGRA